MATSRNPIIHILVTLGLTCASAISAAAQFYQQGNVALSGDLDPLLALVHDHCEAYLAAEVLP